MLFPCIFFATITHPIDYQQDKFNVFFKIRLTVVE